MKLVCKGCGELMLYMSGPEASLNLQPICDMVRSIKNKCPKCGRKISQEDVENFSTKISGERVNAQFFANHKNQRSQRPIVFTNAKLTGLVAFREKRKVKT